MTQSNPDHDKVAAKAARAKRKAAEKRRVAEELRTLTARQLAAAKLAAEKLDGDLHAAHGTAARRDTLSSHLNAFYAEIDKLTKGKTLIPVTDLVVEGINEIIRDAKLMVKGDIYLDRVKEFVPAGDNPVYPDVLMTARTIVESLERFKHHLENHEKKIAELILEATTIQAAAQHYLDNDVVPTKDQAKAALGGKFIPDTWFLMDQSTGEKQFDFVRLDKCSLEQYFSTDDQREVQ